jgi:hypothetical protein
MRQLLLEEDVDVVVLVDFVVDPVEDMVKDGLVAINTSMMHTPAMKVKRKAMKKT